MTDSAPDGDPYRLVTYQKNPKKARMDQAEQEEEQNKTETSLHIVFKKLMKSGTEINVAANVKHLLTTMTKADPMLAVLAFDRQASLVLNTDKFPSDENKFKKFFIIHPRTSNPLLKNQLSIGCILRSN